MSAHYSPVDYYVLGGSYPRDELRKPYPMRGRRVLPFVLVPVSPVAPEVGELHGTILPPSTLSGSIYVTHYTTGRITPPLTLLGSQFTTTLAGNIRPTQQPGGSSQ